MSYKPTAEANSVHSTPTALFQYSDPLPKIDGRTNFELIKYQVGPLMVHLREEVANENGAPVFWIDLFSGAGGTTSGIHLANNQNIKVIACVNHDRKAILSHKANHPNCIHLVEDIRDFNVVIALKKVVNQLRIDFPGCVINCWFSHDCTNYSKAKGGLPRDADDRSLPNSLFMKYDADKKEFFDGDSYIQMLDPDFIYVENVEEFMCWGPMDEKGKPLSKYKGKEYLKWIKNIQSFGYDFDYQFLNAADFDGYQSRERYFAIFARNGAPIRWPHPTNSKKPHEGGLFNPLKKWNAVRDVIDFDEEGQSMFTNSRLTSEKTDIRILDGCKKFIPKQEKTFLSHYYGNGFNTSIHSPCPTIRTKDSASMIDSVFLLDYHGKSKSRSLNGPCPALTTKDKYAPVRIDFLTSYYSGGGQITSIDKPCPTVTTVPKHNVTTALFMDQQFGQSKPCSIDKPCPAITTNPKYDIVAPWIMNTSFNNVGSSIDEPSPTVLACRKHHYLMNPQFTSKGSSIDNPCFTLIASMDKRPPSLVSTDGVNSNKIEICWIKEKLHRAADVLSDGTIIYYFSFKDNPTRRKIKWFMIEHGIIDIKKRMLTIKELLRIQGFPDNYILNGTQEDQKKWIGNAVHTAVAKRLAETNYEAVQEWKARCIA